MKPNMCLTDWKKFSSILLLLIAYKTNSASCDIIVNTTTPTSENHTSVIECQNTTNIDGVIQEDCIVKDHHVVIVKKIDSYLNQPSSIYNSHNERLKHTSILYGIVLLAQENELNQKCYNDIMQIYDGINRKEIWAMKSKLMVDTVLGFPRSKKYV